MAGQSLSYDCKVVNALFCPPGCVYMNGDIAKLPSGAVYSTTPENIPLSTSISNTDFR